MSKYTVWLNCCTPRVPHQWNSVPGGGDVLSTCNVMERGMNMMQYFSNSRTPTDDKHRLKCPSMCTTDDNVYHTDALIRQDTISWHCPNLNTSLGSEHSIFQNQLNLQRSVWILGAKEPPIQLPSSLYGTHTFEVTSTTDSSFWSLFLQRIKPGLRTTLPTVPISCCWFLHLWTPYEAPGWQAICNRTRHEPHSYRHLTPVSSTPGHTPWHNGQIKA